MDNNQMHALLKQYYGYDSFRIGQEELIRNILNGKDVLGIMPTGGGKSICYQIPALMLKGVTVVISPLISLMKDQVDTLCEMGIQAAYINSSLSIDAFNQVVHNAKLGMYKLIYVAPERLETSSFIDFLNTVTVSLLAVDEAHCVSSWGHDFRPSYRQISNTVHRMKKRPIIAAFTATATLTVKDDIIQLLELMDPLEITTGFNRANLYFEVVKPQNKIKHLLDYLNENNDGSGIIYCSTRKTVEAVAHKLSTKGHQVTMYHAGLSEQVRTVNQDDFIYDRKQIMVATNAFGMGIDKSNIRYVVHYNMPKTMESYYQEAGRAGRDGLNSECILLYSASDIITNKLLISNNGEQQAESAYKKLNEIVDYCNTDKCLRSYILNYFGESQTDLTCSHCSNCNNNIEQTDITVESQKIMSCIKRMNERFGASLVTDVLKGSHSKKVVELGLNNLPTHGIMKEYHSDSIKEIISYLISENFIDSRGNKYPVLALNLQSQAVLLGKQKVTIKRVIEKVRPEKDQKQARPFDTSLFEQLRTLRKEQSDIAGVPPFVIFSDASLQEMSRDYPITKERFLGISGVGENKLSKYGDLFIELINEYVNEHHVKVPHESEIRKNPSTEEKLTKPSKLETYDLFNRGLSIADIAEERKMATTTIEGHLLDCLESGLDLEFERIISTEYESQIIEVIKEIGKSPLKPIKEAVPDEVSYTDIKFIIYKNKL